MLVVGHDYRTIEVQTNSQSKIVSHVNHNQTLPAKLPAPAGGPSTETERLEFVKTLGNSQSACPPVALAHLWQNNSPSQLASC